MFAFRQAFSRGVEGMGLLPTKCLYHWIAWERTGSQSDCTGAHGKAMEWKRPWGNLGLVHFRRFSARRRTYLSWQDLTLSSTPFTLGH